MAISKYAEGAYAIISGTPTEVLIKLEEEKIYGSHRVVGMARTEDANNLIVMYHTGSKKVLKDLSHWFKFDYLVSGSNFAYVDDEHYTVYDYSDRRYKGTATVVSGNSVGSLILSGATGTGVDGTLSGAILFISGAGGLLNRHNMWSYMKIEDETSPGGVNRLTGDAQQGTIAAWVNRDQTILTSGHTIFYYGVSGVGNCFAAVEITTGDKLQYVYRNYNDETTPLSTYVIVSGSTAVISGAWFHVAVTSDGNLIRLYVNGAEENIVMSGTNAGQWFGDLNKTTPGATPFATIVGAYLISGGDYTPSATQPTVYQGYQGRIDNLRIATYPMTEGQIKELYDNQI